MLRKSHYKGSNAQKYQRHNYASNFITTVIKHAQQTNSCEVARKYRVIMIKTETET
jgi:hypothetical protein